MGRLGLRLLTLCGAFFLLTSTASTQEAVQPTCCARILAGADRVMLLFDEPGERQIAAVRGDAYGAILFECRGAMTLAQFTALDASARPSGRTWCRMGLWTGSNVMLMGWADAAYLEYTPPPPAPDPLAEPEAPSEDIISDEEAIEGEDHTGIAEGLLSPESRKIIIGAVVSVVLLPFIIALLRGLFAGPNSARTATARAPQDEKEEQTSPSSVGAGAHFAMSLLIGAAIIVAAARLSEHLLPGADYFQFSQAMALVKGLNYEIQPVTATLIHFSFPLLAGLVLGVVWRAYGRAAAPYAGVLGSLLLWWPNFYLWDSVAYFGDEGDAAYFDMRLEFLGLYLVHAATCAMIVVAGAGLGDMVWRLKAFSAGGALAGLRTDFIARGKELAAAIALGVVSYMLNATLIGT